MRQRKRRDHESRSERCYVADLEDGERVHKCGQPLEAGKVKETNSPESLLKETQPCQDLDFSPLRLKSGF